MLMLFVVCRQLKVHSVEDYRVLQSISYPAPILSIGMSVSMLIVEIFRLYQFVHISLSFPPLTPPSQPSDSHLVVGMTTKLLSIKHRPTRTEGQSLLSLSQLVPRGGTYRYFVRGRTYKPTDVSTCR